MSMQEIEITTDTSSDLRVTTSDRVMRNRPSTTRGGKGGLQPTKVAIVVLTILCLALGGGLFLALKPRPIPTLTTTGDDEAPSSPSPSPASVCDTPACVKASAAILESITSHDPCDDFYEHACGAWHTANPMPADKSSMSSFGVLADDNRVLLRSLLEASGGPEVTEKARLYYAKCIDMAPINALGASPVAPDLAILGWRSGPDPVWSASDWASLGTALAHMHRSSTWPLFYSWTMADARNPTVNKVHIGQDGLGLGSRDYYLGKDPYSDPYLVAYHRYLDTLLELSSSILPQAADPSYRNATAHSVIAFETAIAAAQLPSAVLRNPAVSYNAWTRAQLQNETGPNFFWGAYQNALYSDVRGPGQSVPEPIIVDAPPYYRSLFGIVELTPVPTVMAYLQLMWLANSAPHLSQDFVDAQFELSKVTQGVKAQTERWKTCVSRTDSALGYLTGRAFVDHAFSPESLRSTLTMIGGIKDAFRANLPAVEWMDDPTRQAAHVKVDQNANMIGYPEWILNDTAVAEYYAAMPFGASSTYFDGHKQANRFEIRLNILDIDIPVDRYRWGMSPPTVNAYFSPTKNEIVFPAGILQPPFYHGHEGIDAINFGGIGAVIGHELTHGFDDQGARYDGTGKLRAWWSPEVVDAFYARTRCVSNEYSHFTMNTGQVIENVNGNLTLGENIADNGGIKLAYNAWYRLHKDGNERLPGLPQYTGEQLFFMSYAQVWCGTIRPSSAHARLLTDPHSPSRYRVNGVVQNVPAFAAAFQCPVGARMNRPEARCTVW